MFTLTQFYLAVLKPWTIEHKGTYKAFHQKMNIYGLIMGVAKKHYYPLIVGVKTREG